MTEQTVQRQIAVEPAPLVSTVDLFDDPGSTAELCRGSVKVTYGASEQCMPLAGLSVSEARKLVETILDVDARSHALINGRRARPQQEIVEGDALEFVHHAGEKG